MSPIVSQPPARLPESIRAPRTDPAYRCHGYLTKVPLAAIRPWIEALTEPGELVVDFFAGSGMTGVAALGLGRRAHLSDISILGRHIFTGYVTQVPGEALVGAAHTVCERARSALGDLYETRRAPDGARAEMIRTLWSFTYVCPGCAYALVYFEHLDDSGRAPTHCPGCAAPFARRRWPRGRDVPVRVVVLGASGRQNEQAVAAHDRERMERATSDPRLSDVPSLEIDSDREMYRRSGLARSGLTETARFFSPRNAIALLELWRAIESVADGELRQALRFAFTAILPRASRRYQWSARRPLNAQNQTYYVAPVYYEWNVFDLFTRKVAAVRRAHAHLWGAHAQRAAPGAAPAPLDATYSIASADRLDHLADASADYVFVDPPFGSNIFYSDMNLFQEAWLGETTQPRDEAVLHTSGPRRRGAAERYERLLRAAFAEGWRVLRPGRHLTLVFGNSDGQVWGRVQRALRGAGFRAPPIHVATLDKGQRSVKGLRSGSERVATLDLVLTFRKPAPGEPPPAIPTRSEASAAQRIAEALAELGPAPPCTPSELYARVLTRAVQRGLALDALSLADVQRALQQAGYRVDARHGTLIAPVAGSRRSGRPPRISPGA